MGWFEKCGLEQGIPVCWTLIDLFLFDLSLKLHLTRSRAQPNRLLWWTARLQRRTKFVRHVVILLFERLIRPRDTLGGKLQCKPWRLDKQFRLRVRWVGGWNHNNAFMIWYLDFLFSYLTIDLRIHGYMCICISLGQPHNCWCRICFSHDIKVTDGFAGCKKMGTNSIHHG